MFNYESGKRYTIIGFGGYLTLSIISLLFSAVWYVLANSIVQNLLIGRLLSLATIASLLIAAGGFGIMWLEQRKFIDFVTAGTVGISAVLRIFNSFRPANLLYFSGKATYASASMLSLLISLLLAIFYIVLSVRAFQFNKIFSLLLVLAFLYTIFSGMLISIFYAKLGIPLFIVLCVREFGYVVCAALCFLECKQEQY